MYDVAAVQEPLTSLMHLWEKLLLKQPLDSPVSYLTNPQIEQWQAMLNGDIKFGQAELDSFSTGKGDEGDSGTDLHLDGKCQGYANDHNEQLSDLRCLRPPQQVGDMSVSSREQVGVCTGSLSIVGTELSSEAGNSQEASD